MAISAAVIELALAFENELASGGRPSFEVYLGRSPSPADRLDLLVQLLACESGHENWESDRLWTRMNAFPELLAAGQRAAELLRIVYRDRIASRLPTTWDMFRRFGLTAGQLQLCYECEPHNLGEHLLGRYELVERLGAGTFGVVYRATDPVWGGPVAVKVPHYPRKPELASAMLRREWQVLRSLKHPRIVASRAFEDAPGMMFLVLDFLPGGSLLRLLGAGLLEPLAACRLAMQVTEALEFAHSAGIFHRDVKPENILLDQNGEALVSDFGFALSMDDQWDKEGEVAGTFPYMAPELLLGCTHQIDGRADLWSVGTILLELLTGSRLSPGNSREEALVASVVRGRDEVNLPDDVPAVLHSIVTRCLRLDPNERYDSVGQLRRDLAQAMDLLASAHSPGGTPHSATGKLLRVWRLGVKMGLARADHEAFAACCAEIPLSSLEADQALPPPLVNKIGFGVMHEVAAVKAYEEACTVARGIGLDLPEMPKANARCATIIYRGNRLTCADIHNLPSLVESFGRVLDTANAEATDFVRRLGEQVSYLYQFARDGAQSRPGNDSATLAIYASGAGIPDLLWAPFTDALRAGAKVDEIRKGFNQLDKQIERFLAERTQQV